MKIKNDIYRMRRGCTSVILEISCSQCGQHLGCYQKDGGGVLKRLYQDRFEPYDEVLRDGKCITCRNFFGIPYIYKKEKRPAIKLEKHGIVKKKI